MNQIIFDGISIVSFFIAGTVGLLIAGELLYRVYELALSAINKKLSGLISSSNKQRNQKPLLNCSCHALPVRFRG